MFSFLFIITPSFFLLKFDTHSGYCKMGVAFRPPLPMGTEVLSPLEDRKAVLAMEQNLDAEALKQRVSELEKRLKEYERKEGRQNFQG